MPGSRPGTPEMTPNHARYAVCTFVLLSAGVAGNVMFLQGGAGGGRKETERTQSRIEAERARRLSADQPADKVNAVAPLPHTQPFLINAQPVPPAPLAAIKPDAKKPVEAARKPLEPTASEPILTTGAPDSPEIVSSIQRELQVRGYDPGTPDGVAGTVTRAAIMAWEHDHGLVPTGEATEAVMKAIVLGVSGPLAAQITTQWQALPKEKRLRTEVLVRSIQQSLATLGYNPGKITGRTNQETERAIREFEMDQNLTQSGRISAPLVSRLARLTVPNRTAAPR